MCLKKVAVSNAAMPGRCNLRRAPQYFLINHKFAVVFADSPGGFCKSGIGQVRTFGPLPAFAPFKLRGCCFPFKLCWQSQAFPRGKSVSLEITDMANRLF